MHAKGRDKDAVENQGKAAGSGTECRVTQHPPFLFLPFTQSIPIPPIHADASVHLPGQQGPARPAAAASEDVLVNCEASAASLPSPFNSLLAKQFFCAVLQFNSETAVQIGAPLFCAVFFFHFLSQEWSLKTPD